MSGELSLFDSSAAVPAHIRAAADKTTADIAGGGVGKRLSMRGKVWRLIHNGNEVSNSTTSSLNVVVVAASEGTSRAYYSKEWKEGDKNVAPDCYSAKGDVPHPNAINKQSATCFACPQNIAGTAKHGGTARACKFNKRLAVVLEKGIDGDVYQFTLPATSIFGEGKPNAFPLQAYGKQLSARQLPISSVVTQMTFDTTVSVPKVLFSPVRYLSEEEMAIVAKQAESEDCKQALSFEYTNPTSGETPKGNPQVEFNIAPAPVSAPAVATAPVQAPPAVAPAPVAVSEPVVVSSSPQEISKDVAVLNAIEAWDDE